jgi:UDP-glucuronate 4-epimerase
VEINYVDTQLLLAAATSARISPLFVFASTSSVYGQTNKVPFVETDSCALPLSPYAASKRSAELLAHVYYNLNSLNVTILRFFNIYGPRGRPDMLPFKLMQACFDSSHVLDVYDNGKMQRDWTYIDDAIDAVMAALERPFGYEIINVGYGAPIPASQMINIVQNISNREIRVQYKKSSRAEPSITFCDNSKARMLLGFNPRVNVSEGLRKMWLWFRHKYRKNKQ